MTYETKYQVGQELYAVYSRANEAFIERVKIDRIVILKDSIIYKSKYSEYAENQLFDYRVGWYEDLFALHVFWSVFEEPRVFYS